jgi:hypothetical protein
MLSGPNMAAASVHGYGITPIVPICEMSRIPRSPFGLAPADMDISRLTPAPARPHTLHDARAKPHDVAAGVINALDRLCANGRGDEWNAFLLDIRQGATGEYLVRMGVFGPIQSELTVRASQLGGPDAVSSVVTRAVAEWIAKYDVPSAAERRGRRVSHRVSLVTCRAASS